MGAPRGLAVGLAALWCLAASAQPVPPPSEDPRTQHHRDPYAGAPPAWGSVDAPARAGVPYWLGIDEAPLRFDAYFAAGGPLQRLADRPGAWYGIVFVPLAARWPAQFVAWQRSTSHQMRVIALDGWPGSAAQTAVAMPLRFDPGPRGRPVITSAPFVIASASRAEGVFLLIEQWSNSGTRPAAIWLQARAGEHGYGERGYSERSRGDGRSAWWLSADARAAAGTDAHAAPPPGPLVAPRPTATAIELPIFRLLTPPPRPAPRFEPWWDR